MSRYRHSIESKYKSINHSTLDICLHTTMLPSLELLRVVSYLVMFTIVPIVNDGLIGLCCVVVEVVCCWTALSTTGVENTQL